MTLEKKKVATGAQRSKSAVNLDALKRPPQHLSPRERSEYSQLSDAIWTGRISAPDLLTYLLAFAAPVVLRIYDQYRSDPEVAKRGRLLSRLRDEHSGVRAAEDDLDPALVIANAKIAFSLLRSVRRKSDVRNALEQLASAYNLAAEDTRRLKAGVTEPYASLPRYADREQGEDAIGFFKRVWGAVPRPIFREDVAAHDPDLIEAISMRCRNLNRRRGEERVYPADILPPPRPAGERTAARRKGDRERKARRGDQHLRP